MTNEQPDWTGKMRVALMGLGPRRLGPVLRQFQPAAPEVRDRLTAIVDSFAAGYHAGLGAPTVDALLATLEGHDPERRGFAYEGAGMGAALRVQIAGGDLLRRFLAAADAHHYIVQIGAGWAMARLPIRHGAVVAQLDPTYHWLAWDGYGFHEALFHPDETVDRGGRTPRRTDAALEAFDHGVGRALWFVRTADPARVRAAIDGLSVERRPHVWGGVGLAAGYAGGVPDEVLHALVDAAGAHRAAMGVGTLLALHTRDRAGNTSAHTDRAVRVLCGVDPDAARARTWELVRAAGTGDAAYPALREALRRWLA